MVITPDTWKDDARNTTESGGGKLNENKALTSKKARFDPYRKNKFSTCRICKSSVHQPGSHYSQGCAYKNGICAMRGKRFWIPKTISKCLSRCIDEVSGFLYMILLFALNFQGVS